MESEQIRPNPTNTGKQGRTPTWEEVKAAQAGADYQRDTYGPGTDRELSAWRIAGSMSPEDIARNKRIEELKGELALLVNGGNPFDDRANSVRQQLERLSEQS